MSSKLRVVALIGERYFIGRLAYRAVLRSPDVELTHLVLATDDRWRRYERALLGPEHTAPEPSWYVRYASALGLVPLREQLRSAVRAALEPQTGPRRHIPASELSPAPPVPPIVVDDANDAALIERVRADQVDVVLVGGFPQILGGAWTTLGQRASLNLHPSALPRQRGSQPMWWTVRDGEPFGFTVHKLERSFDAGDILVQALAPQPEGGTARDYMAWLETTVPETVGEAFRQLRHGQERWTPQDHAQATERRWPRAIHRKIAWADEGADSIARKVRAGVLPYPIRAFFFLAGRRVEVAAATPLEPGAYMTNDIAPPPGTVLAYGADWLDVATVDGALRLSELTLHGWPLRCANIAHVGLRAT